MERLTHKIVYDNEHYQYVFDYNQDVEVGTKLGELEDVLEKYNIENIGDLELRLEDIEHYAYQENKQLKHQLAEKDKEIKELKDFTENTANLIDKLTEDSVFASTQLAIEELEKLKENAWQSATDISQLIDYTELAKIIDNQIKELGGEKNE